MDDEAAIDRLLSYEAIRQLVYRYAVAVDARDTEAVAELFVEDVTVAPGVTGRAALRDSYDQMLSEQAGSILNVGNHAIDFDDADHARGIVYCRAEIDAGEEWIVQAIAYHDRYERHHGTWLFRGRKHLLFYGGDMLTRPNTLSPAAKPEIGTGRGSATASLREAVARWRSDPGTTAPSAT